MRPLVSGFFAGVILGDPVAGALIGAQINVLYLGWIGAGGALPSDIALAGVIGTSFAITGKLDANTAMALAVPVGLLGTLIWVGKMTFNTGFVRMAEGFLERREVGRFWYANVSGPQLALWVFSFFPAFILAYFGSSYLEAILAFLGERTLGVLGIIGGMLPAVGIALTLTMIFKGQTIPFFFLGFLTTQYFKMDMAAVGFLSVVIAIIYLQSNRPAGEQEQALVPSAAQAKAGAYGLLDRRTIRRSWVRWVMFNQANYNYERMQATGFAHAMLPVFRKLYPGDSATQAERLKLHLQFFNTEPQWGACIIGLTAAMEEKRAQGYENITDETISSTKTGLMGPIAGIGDTIDGGVVTPVLLSVFIGITIQGNALGPIGYILAIATFMWSIYWFSYRLGYEQGSSAILLVLESGRINQLILGVSVVGCMVLGSLVGTFVQLSLGVTIPLGSGEKFSLQQQLVDRILPGMLPLALTMGCWFLQKRGWTSLRVILLVALIGGIGGLTGVLAVPNS